MVALSRDLLGKVLVTELEGQVMAGRIVETEAYAGVEDKASHAYGGRRTRRDAPMYLEGGHAYVYLCYGIHRLFNVVTSGAEIPQATLVRAIEPLIGVAVMQERRGLTRLERCVSGGPGLLTQALGLTLEHDGLPLRKTVWIGDDGAQPDSIASPRTQIATLTSARG